VNKREESLKFIVMYIYLYIIEFNGLYGLAWFL